MSDGSAQGSGESVRLQKFLSRAGVASRRAAEELIRAGRVRVDGATVTELGSRVLPGEQVVEVDGRRVEPGAPIWIALHKPPGYLCTRDDPEGRPTVYDLLPESARNLFHVGRLDFMSEGLLLLTNDGDLAHRLLHPSHETPRRYEVTLEGPLPPRLAERLLSGVELEDGPAAAATATVVPGPGPDEWSLLLTLKEGRNREIRRMMERLGVTVLSLRRLAFGSVTLGELRPGEHRRLSDPETASLRRSADAAGADRAGASP